MTLILEKSCGAVIFTENKAGERLWLIERMQKGHASLCKGHVEGDETEQETAAREIREETGLSVRFLPGWQRSIEYSPAPGRWKRVIFFLAKASQMQTVLQPEEVREILWLPLEAALAELTYVSDRETLCAAADALEREAP